MSKEDIQKLNKILSPEENNNKNNNNLNLNNNTFKNKKTVDF